MNGAYAPPLTALPAFAGRQSRGDSKECCRPALLSEMGTFHDRTAKAAFPHFPRKNDHGEKHPVLISSWQEYAPDLCEMLLWSSLLWHIRGQKELGTGFARRKKDLHICDGCSLAYHCTRLERLGFPRRGPRKSRG